MHRLVLLAKTEAGVVYPKELYGFCIPAFSEVCGDEVEDTVVSAAVQGEAKPDGHWGQSSPSQVLRAGGTLVLHVIRKQGGTRSFMECLFRQLGRINTGIMGSCAMGGF
jgi:hypothetical protein